MSKLEILSKDKILFVFSSPNFNINCFCSIFEKFLSFKYSLRDPHIKALSSISLFETITSFPVIFFIVLSIFLSISEIL